MLRLVTPNDFRALQLIALLAGLAVFPAVFFLGRELRLRVEIALVAGLLCAFFPNVWFFGGTAFSDVPSIVLAVVAVGSLLPGCPCAQADLTGPLVPARALRLPTHKVLQRLRPGVSAPRCLA